MNTQKKKEIKEKKFLCFIENFLKENEYSPSFREIAEEFNCSLNTVHKTLHNLKEQGFISFDCGKNRTIAIIKKDKKMTNYEKIKAMSIEEMAEFMFDENENNYNYCDFCKQYSNYAPHCESVDYEEGCKKARMEWLESEAEENG